MPKPEKKTEDDPKKKRKKRAVIPKKPKPPSVIEIDEVFKHINQVQINRKPVSFTVDEKDSPVVNNLLKDAGLPFERFTTRVEQPTCPKEVFEGDFITKYMVEPGPEREVAENALEDLDELDDEILEDGQIFP